MSSPPHSRRISLPGSIRLCYILFLSSMAPDYRLPIKEYGTDQTGGSSLQILYTGLAIGSAAMGILIGRRYVLVRPGAYLLILLLAYLVLALGSGILQGNDLRFVVRSTMNLGLMLLGLTLTLAAANSGMRPINAVRWLVAVGMINVMCRLVAGFSLFQVNLDEVRMEILSPANRYLFSYSTCLLLLSTRSRWHGILTLALPAAVSLISVTRTLMLPIALSGAAAVGALCLAWWWKLVPTHVLLRRLGGAALLASAFLVTVILIFSANRELRDRWVTRMFDNRGNGGEIREDPSIIMRKAEVVAMYRIMREDPKSFLFGKGPGCPYYWDSSFFPELYQIFVRGDGFMNEMFVDTIYTGGESIWSYGFFTTGSVGVTMLALTMIGTGYLSLRAVRNLALTGKGPPEDLHLMFLPAIVLLALLSESVTSNSLEERLSGMFFGVIAGLPQFYFHRAWQARCGGSDV